MRTPPLKAKAKQTAKIIRIENDEVNHPILLKYLNFLCPVLTTHINDKFERIKPALINIKAILKIVKAAKAYGCAVSSILGICAYKFEADCFIEVISVNAFVTFYLNELL